jgi:hypothetical protein
MSLTTTSPINTLKNLIQTLHDGQEGFKKASENVKDSHLKEVFTIVGSMHRGWIDLKSALTSHDNHAVLAEAERGEDVAKKAYKDALAKELTAPIRQIVMRQAEAIQLAHDEVKTLRDAAKAEKA